MIDYLEIRSMYHSAFTEEDKARRKAELKCINQDFYEDLPPQLRAIMDNLRWTYRNQPWFEEAWEKYRKHVLDAGLGGKIKMPGFVFNEYIDRYVDDQEKKMKKELVHMETCDVEELYHHGIKGQRWGVRRYQNEDGTLTAEGKKRYGTVGLKEVSLDTIEKERRAYREKLTNDSDDMKKAKSLEDKARALAKKYDFDPDDGGGGSTKESNDAGIKYMELWQEIDRLRKPYTYGGQKYYESKKKTEEYLTNKYGTFRMSMLKAKENASKIAFGASVVTALLAGGFIYVKSH